MMIVSVYWNSTKKVWSVMKGGKVVARTPCLSLKNCKFLVSEKIRQKVLLKKRKFVHAFVEGEVVSLSGGEIPALSKEVRYNPYRNETFMTGEQPIFGADLVLMTKVDGRAVVLAGENHQS